MKHALTWKPVGHTADRRNGHIVVGWSVAAVGCFWLAKAVGWIPAAAGSSLLWPALLVAAGLWMALSSRHRRPASQKPKASLDP